jgi:hypothetical protein
LLFNAVLPEQKVKIIHSRIGLGLIQFRKAALRTGKGDEFLVLHIEYFRKIPACGLKLVGFILGVAALGAHVISAFLIHTKALLLTWAGIARQHDLSTAKPRFQYTMYQMSFQLFHSCA